MDQFLYFCYTQRRVVQMFILGWSISTLIIFTK